MAEALFDSEGESIDFTPAVAVAAGEVIQFFDGRVAFAPRAIAAGIKGAVQVKGVAKLEKTTSMVLLPGGRAYWDASAGKVHYKKVNDRDFYIGRVAADAASADTTCYVTLNIDPQYDIDLLLGEGGNLSVPTGTQATGTAGFGMPIPFGRSVSLRLTATNEAQCIDMLSVDRFAVGANAIAEFIIRLGAGGSGSASDFNWGLANGTSTTDADAITESAFFHFDGGALTINAESDDGTTEVAATTTGISFGAGTAVADRVEFWLDARDISDIKYYINGAEVNSGTANLGNLALAAGPLGLLIHLEKTSGTETFGPVYIDRACCRLMEQ